MSDTNTQQTAPQEAKPSHPRDCHVGLNDILVKTAHYGLKPMIFEKSVELKLRDGTTTYANVFRPKEPGRYPVVLSVDPYGKDSIHMEREATLPSGSPHTHGQYWASDFAAWEAPDPGFWVPNGYVVVKGSARGTDGSKGLISPLSQMEAEDYADFVTWAGTQDWSNGRVGTNGVSYLAMNQWRLGQLNPKHLKAMIPWEGVSDLYREWAFRGGIPETGFTPFWDRGMRTRWPDSPLDPMVKGAEEHPFLDDYWKARHGDLARIKMPIYVCASWSTQGLHSRGTIEGWKQASSKEKWLDIHGRKEWETYYSREALEKQLRFFNRYLKNEKNGWEAMPRVRYEMRERFYEGEFKYASSFPLKGTDYTPLYLDAEKKTFRSRPVSKKASVSYDSTSPMTAKGKAVFTMPFARDTELTGHMKLKLFVSTDKADDMDLFVGVKKLDGRGKEVLMADFNHKENGRVAKGWLRVSHRELDKKRSKKYQPWLKHEQALKLTPGEIVPVEIEILASSTMFRKGESIEVTVQGGDLTYEATAQLPAEHGRITNLHKTLANKGRHTIHAGGKYDSHLLVPVIPG